ncbi:MAG: hypothetical protein IH616_05900 [Gemmatimonadales bacterium]|jgi:hypothetical protein|nr:hypothetical protein [Gemmatimonadales bacterium]
MLRPVLIVGAVGVGGYVAWQVFMAFILPLIGAVLGFLWMVLKIAALIGLAYWIYRMLMKSVTTKPETES